MSLLIRLVTGWQLASKEMELDRKRERWRGRDGGGEWWGRDGERGGSCSVFYNLLLGVTYHHFCHILLGYTNHLLNSSGRSINIRCEHWRSDLGSWMA